MVKKQPYSGHFSPLDSSVYELFRSPLYNGVWFSELSQPKVFRVSENFKTLLGYKITDSVDWVNLIAPSDLSTFNYHIEQISNSEYAHPIDLRFIHRDGSILWMQSNIYSKPIPDHESQFIFVAFKLYTAYDKNELISLSQQQRNQDILATSGIGTWEFNMITGQNIFNESCANITGYTLEELNSGEKYFWEHLTHPEDLQKTKDLIQEHIEQKTPGFKNEMRIRHKNGHWVWVVDSGKVLTYTKDGEPEWLGGIHYAITDRKNAEILIEQYKSLLEDVNEAASIGIWEVNLITNHVYCSDQIKTIFGVSFAPDSRIEDIVDYVKEGTSRQLLLNSVKNAIEIGENYDIEIEIITSDQRTLWCRAIGISIFEDGKCERFYGFFQNINDKVLALKKLVWKEELFRKTFSHAAVGMAIIDLKGSISRVNKSLCHYLGYSEKYLLGKSFHHFSHPQDRHLGDEFIDDLLLGKRESFHLDKRYLHKNGTVLWGHISVSSVRNEMGRIAYFVVQVQDITIRKENELLLLNYKDLLERSNAVAKIGSWEIDINSHKVTWSESLNAILNTRTEYDPTYHESIDYFVIDAHKELLQASIQAALEKGENFDIQILVRNVESEPKWMRMIGIAELENNTCIRLYGLIQDINDIKKAQWEIFEKEEQWRTTFNHSNAGIALINFNGVAYNVNSSLADIFGYSVDELQQLKIQEISLPEDVDKYITLMGQIIDGTIDDFSEELRFRHQQGHIIWANVSVSSVKNDFNRFTHMVAQVVDITASKTNEILLKKYKDLLETSNEVARIGSWELNAQTQVLYWSDNLKRLLGNKDYEDHEFGHSILDYVLEDHQEEMMELFKDAITNGNNFDLELQLKTASGLRWMRVIGISNFKQGICKSVHGLVQDIEDFKSAQHEILLREEEFRQTFWHAPIGMALMDLNGNVVRVNPGMCETFGYTQEELIQLERNALSYPNDIESTERFSQKLLKGELESFQQEKRYFHRNGSLIWTMLSMSAVKNDKGRTTHFVCQISNITREKQLTESLTEHNNRLQNYAHIVSHNLRSHSGNLSMLLELSEMNDRTGFEDDVFQHIKTASNNMCETVNHLSDIVEIQNLIKTTLVPLNLRKRVKKALKNLESALTQINGEVIFKVKKELVIYGISSYVDSILLNILTNAIKYKSPKRLLVIDIKAKKTNGYTILSIADNGLGIDLDKNGEKIFGMYKTFHTHKNARGIGLFLTKNQIEAIGGSIQVESEPDVGSKFTIYFKDEEN